MNSADNERAGNANQSDKRDGDVPMENTIELGKLETEEQRGRSQKITPLKDRLRMRQQTKYYDTPRKYRNKQKR